MKSKSKIGVESGRKFRNKDIWDNLFYTAKCLILLELSVEEEKNLP